MNRERQEAFDALEEAEVVYEAAQADLLSSVSELERATHERNEKYEVRKKARDEFWAARRRLNGTLSPPCDRITDPTEGQPAVVSIPEAPEHHTTEKT